MKTLARQKLLERVQYAAGRARVSLSRTGSVAQYWIKEAKRCLELANVK